MKNWALITGASQGIGYEFTKLFAAEGRNLVLVARDEAKLQQVAGEISSKFKVQTKVLPKDLARPNAAQEIFDELQREGIEIDTLINNAGFGFQGAFLEVPLEKHLDLIQVNITALVQLTNLFGKPMKQRGAGRILNVSSTAAFQPGPYMAMYYASKAFVYSFSCAIAEEFRGAGVTVTTLNPGITRSQFHSRAHLKREVGMLIMEADEVAKIGYRALLKGKPIVTAGLMNKISSSVAKTMPTRFVTKIAGKMNKGNGD